jgi:hypothetical protein
MMNGYGAQATTGGAQAHPGDAGERREPGVGGVGVGDVGDVGDAGEVQVRRGLRVACFRRELVPWKSFCMAAERG